MILIINTAPVYSWNALHVCKKERKKKKKQTQNPHTNKQNMPTCLPLEVDAGKKQKTKKQLLIRIDRRV